MANIRAAFTSQEKLSPLDLITHCSKLMQEDPILQEKAKKLLELIEEKAPQTEAAPQFTPQPESILADDVIVSNANQPGLRNRKHPSLNQPSKTFAHQNLFTTAKPAPVVKPYQDDSFIQLLGKSYLQNVFGVKGLIALGLGNLVVGTAAQEAVYHAGKGTKNMCSGLVWCIQGYLKDNNGEKLANVMREISLTSNKGSFVTEIALSDCFTQSKMKSMMNDMMDEVTNWLGNTTCSLDSKVWQDTQFSAKATNLSAEGCEALGNAFKSAVNECQTAETFGKAFGIGVGITAGAIVVGVAVMFGAIYGYRTWANDECSRPACFRKPITV